MKLIGILLAGIVVALLLWAVPMALVWAIARLVHVVPVYGFGEWLAAVVVMLLLGAVGRTSW